MVNELVSVIMPAYNSEKTISKSIDSVLNQTYTNWELIIVDDVSKDGTMKVLEKYKNNNKIKIIQNLENSRAAKTRNMALDFANGRYIAFLDSDDLWTPNKLEKQLAYMTANNIGFTFSSYNCIDENDKSINRTINVPNKISHMELLGNTIIGCSTVMVDKSIIGDFRFVTNARGEDTFTWYSLLKRGHLAYGIKEILANYRVVHSSSSGNKLKMASEYWRGLKVATELSFGKRVCCFVSYAFNACKKRI